MDRPPGRRRTPTPSRGRDQPATAQGSGATERGAGDGGRAYAAAPPATGPTCLGPQATKVTDGLRGLAPPCQGGGREDLEEPQEDGQRQ
eukprot:7588085-Alexandrium_andersonii.AAC.1